MAFPVWVMELIAHPVAGVVSKTEFLSVKAILDLGNELIERQRDLFSGRQQLDLRRKMIAVPLGAYREMTALSDEELAYRKQVVVDALGYDPAKPRLAEWCFDPDKPPADAPWHDPEELRRSMARINAFMASGKSVL